jgi:hypothetical protein
MKMEDDLNFLNGRRPQIFWKWKKTSTFLKLEDDLILFCKWKKKSKIWKIEEDLILFKMEDDLKCFENGRQKKIKMEDYLICFKNGRQP